MTFFQKILIASTMTLAPVASQALTITESFGLTINDFGTLNADITADSAGVTVAFDDSDFFEDENPESTIFPFFFSLQPRTGGFTELRVQSNICEDGSCGFRGFRDNFGFSFDGEDLASDLDRVIFPGDVDIDQVFTIDDLPPTSDGSIFGQQFEVIFLDPFATGDELPRFSLTFDYFPEDTPTVIPLPAPGFLLLGALGGLAWMRRKES